MNDWQKTWTYGFYSVHSRIFLERAIFKNLILFNGSTVHLQLLFVSIYPMKNPFSQLQSTRFKPNWFRVSTNTITTNATTWHYGHAILIYSKSWNLAKNKILLPWYLQTTYLHPKEEFPGGRFKLEYIHSAGGALWYMFKFYVIRKND